MKKEDDDEGAVMKRPKTEVKLELEQKVMPVRTMITVKHEPEVDRETSDVVTDGYEGYSPADTDAVADGYERYFADGDLSPIAESDPEMEW